MVGAQRSNRCDTCRRRKIKVSRYMPRMQHRNCGIATTDASRSAMKLGLSAGNAKPRTACALQGLRSRFSMKVRRFFVNTELLPIFQATQMPETTSLRSTLLSSRRLYRAVNRTTPVRVPAYTTRYPLRHRSSSALPSLTPYNSKTSRITSECLENSFGRCLGISAAVRLWMVQ